MKQISITLNIVLILTLVYFSCKQRDQSTDGATTQGNYSRPCTTCNTPFTGVAAKDFMEVVARYRKTRWDLINPEMQSRGLINKADSRSVWFSLDTIKKFICYIERYSDSVNVNKDSLGIRFYYAVYPGHQTADFGAEYKSRLGQHTIYMVPTTQVANYAVDFDPYRSYQIYGTSGRQISYVANLLDSVTAKNSDLHLLMLSGDGKRISGSSGNQTFAQNNGKLCPVNCPTPNTLNSVDTKYPSGVDY